MAGEERKFNDVEEFVNSITNLPALPANIQKINDLLNDPKTCAEDISKIVATDQALATKMLRQANSAYYGRVSKVVKVNDAVVLIGMANIKSMLYSIFVNQLYGHAKKSDELMIKMWEHSVAGGLTARKVIEKVSPAHKDACYTAGLLHDIGELILFTYEPQMYRKVLAEIEIDDVMPRTFVEESIMGFTHADLGAVLARKWNLPTTIKNAIFYHHNTTECDIEEDQPVVSAVHVADKLTANAGMGGTDRLPAGKTLRETVINDTMVHLRMDEAVLEEYAKDMGDIKAETGKMMESFTDKR